MEEKFDDELKQEVHKQIKQEIAKIVEEGIQVDNVNMLSKLVDIHKDLENEDYWEVKKEGIEMRYRDYNGYGNYGRNSYGDNYGDNYGRNSYGRRGVKGTGRGRYRGDDMLEEMHEHYGNYMESASYNGQESDKAFDYMLQSAEDFFNHLMEEAQNQEQMEKIKRVARRISEM